MLTDEQRQMIVDALDVLQPDTDEADKARLALIERIAGMTFATDELIGAAIGLHASDEVEIDDVALTSATDEGTWVQAWVWVPRDHAEEEA